MVSPEQVVERLEGEFTWIRAEGFEELDAAAEHADADISDYLRGLLLDEARNMLELIPAAAHDVQWIAERVHENIRDHLNIDGDGMPSWILQRRNEAAGERGAEAGQ